VLAQTDILTAESRTENLNGRCNHMVQQAIALSKKGIRYKQMLDTRRSELQKAESEVFHFFDLLEYVSSKSVMYHFSLILLCIYSIKILICTIFCCWCTLQPKVDPVYCNQFDMHARRFTAGLFN
jgi:hypothetical protein